MPKTMIGETQFIVKPRVKNENCQTELPQGQSSIQFAQLIRTWHLDRGRSHMWLFYGFSCLSFPTPKLPNLCTKVVKKCFV